MATHQPETESELTLGPNDAGRLVSAEQFAEASYIEPWSYERVDGRLVVMAPDGGDHIEAASPWLKRLVIFWTQHPEVVHLVVPNAWVRVDRGKDRIGDLGVYLTGGPSNVKVPQRVPDLMFEIVSPGSESRDRDYVQKRADYHRLGIREYVIVDRFERTATVLTHSPAGYLERVLSTIDTYQSPLLPGLAIAIAEVLEIMTRLRIAGGRVVDPANGVDDVVKDLWIADGRVIEAPTEPDARADRTIDARGYVVMPGGVDVHCHIAGSKVNAARMLRPEEKRGAGALRRAGMRSGTLGSVPSTFTTGYRYAGLGYTTAVDAAIPPLGARHAHHELRDTPVIDKAILVLMGNNHALMDRIRGADRDGLRNHVAWLLRATRGYGVKIVNPGGVESWKQAQGNLTALDDIVPHFEVTPRQVLVELARAVDELGVPHPVHLHCPNLGIPGNWSTTLETLKAVEGHRAHLAHIQFHSYGGIPQDTRAFDSQVPALADYVNTHSGLTVDVGQVVFGDTTSMTADGAVGQFLHTVTGRKWLSHDVEAETGCGVVPITYEDKNFVHALQWAIGLEWYLRVDDPWRIAMSTDHPNGGSFLAYPQIIALLMDRGHRLDTLKRLPERVRARSGLADLDREYTLSEIAVITRAAPARMLGLTEKGHLGRSADGDVAIYAPDADKERMFSLPRYLIKGGIVVVDDGDLRAAPDGRTCTTTLEYDPAVVPRIEEQFARDYSIQFANFAVDDDDLGVEVRSGGARRNEAGSA